MSEDVYDLFMRGSQLLEAGDFSAATIPLEKARRLEPDKTSIREALGRAYFRSGRYAEARDEFAAVVERSPVNDFAHFCLGRALEKTGRRTEARRHLTLAVGLRPDRADYRVYRDRLRAA
ncbi:MAG TPA: tetratricopeptide repeat protein [Thermoleophilaceae bacterium]|nr:tetratricopeptide repeat protein [Thermoleophilaceae bacterium]